jgi:dihydroorotase
MRRYQLDPARMNLYAFLNISGSGLLSDYVGEGSDLRWLDAAACAAIAKENRDRIVGVKVRQDLARVGENGLEPLRRAVAAAELLGLPVMVHVGRLPAPMPELAQLLRPGDIITHSFHGWSSGVLDDGGQVHPELWEAADRGIIFDVGHGAGSFSFPVMEAALEQDFLPHTISSDLHVYSVNGPVYDLPTTMAKFLYLGMSLEEVVRRVTVDAAKAVRLEHVAGSLAPGRRADVTLLQEIEGRFRFDDCFGNKRLAERTLVPRWVVLEGEVLPAATAAPWR